jgi:hypothetical protein
MQLTKRRIKIIKLYSIIFLVFGFASIDSVYAVKYKPQYKPYSVTKESSAIRPSKGVSIYAVDSITGSYGGEIQEEYGSY